MSFRQCHQPDASYARVKADAEKYNEGVENDFEKIQVPSEDDWRELIKSGVKHKLRTKEEADKEAQSKTQK